MLKRLPNEICLDEGQIDRTEVSMSDLIHVGGGCGHHEMDFAKKQRERREAKERATTLSERFHPLTFNDFMISYH